MHATNGSHVNCTHEAAHRARKIHTEAQTFRLLLHATKKRLIVA
jgi:hypothetical protein